MCLDTITRRIKHVKEKKISFAYKGVDLGSRSGYCFPCNSLTSSRVGLHSINDFFNIPLGVWIKAEGPPLLGILRNNTYPRGFHFYPRKPKKSPYNFIPGEKVIRIRVRGVHTHGRQDGLTVWVANEIFVSKPRKKSRALVESR